ncbi:MAG: exosortase/archaeosortase family protein, partial [Thermomicrobia bacterium]|nr:exosortase/archaeosortase family protein [Thermomicrobia bacterium]
MATVSSIASGRFWQRSSGALLNGVAWRPAVIVISTVAAYFFSLSDLLRAMKYDTPLAYLGLVPPIAFVIGCYRYHRTGAAPAPLGPLDAVAGSALLLLATFIGIGLPVALDAYAWSKRLDLVSLPIFAAGLIIMLYGTSALGWAWPALAYGFLVWPVPYSFLLGQLLNPLMDVTAWGTAHLTPLLPLGAAVDPTDATVFSIATPGRPQAVSIGSACSGFNSFVAWIVIGIALCVIVRGKRGGEGGIAIAGRFALWLIAGAFLTLLGNIARILALFAVVFHSGLSGAFEWVHT